MRKIIYDGVERNISFYRLTQESTPVEQYIVQFVVTDLLGNELFIHEEIGLGILNHGGDIYSVLSLEIVQDGE